MNKLKKIIKNFFQSLSTDEQIGFKLSDGEKVEFKVPQEVLKDQKWKVTEWHIKVGDSVKPGDILCKIESKKEESELESFVGGKVNYRNVSNTIINKDTVLVEIIGN